MAGCCSLVIANFDCFCLLHFVGGRVTRARVGVLWVLGACFECMWVVHGCMHAEEGSCVANLPFVFV